MTEFDEITSHLIQRIENLEKILQIDEREEVAITDHKGQSFIIIHIQDDTQACTITANEIEIVIDNFDITKIFKVSNVSKIGFIPIDGKKGFLGFGTSHCDCVFFDKSDCCFVEFKFNANSLKKVTKNRCQAINQLSNTIDYFDARLDKNYLDLNLEAYVCTPEFYPRDDVAWKSLAIEFLENYGIELFESNHKICK
ncbi:MAG: hypothetical protein EWV76_19960 [Microcystis novacekii Mn_MB_F_20050700_S1]|uniref:Uncharacterized protein n=1 Tax=Microcystis novacekii Mn_MB_F_20050700_S1D TaxID=2486266 RepID=A0A552IZQ8_9CHRO|nr:MAG: hypothetical protein EWV76_19960 [Microcystis novacekii Mn_MB_F_20050700_S1]TRU88989.1 MAG: hypothetical protein EWV54_09345 [Microcystis novacekii Mn_MB_F_20050700_S1D]